MVFILLQFWFYRHCSESGVSAKINFDATQHSMCIKSLQWSNYYTYMTHFCKSNLMSLWRFLTAFLNFFVCDCSNGQSYKFVAGNFEDFHRLKKWSCWKDVSRIQCNISTSNKTLVACWNILFSNQLKV